MNEYWVMKWGKKNCKEKKKKMFIHWRVECDLEFLKKKIES
jgi:hypothetical protein